MIPTTVHITNIEAPSSGGADSTTFGVGECVHVPQHQRKREIIAVFMGTKEPFYTFHDGYGIKGWSETALLALNPSAGIVISEPAKTSDLSPVADVLASGKEYTPENALRADFAPQPTIPDGWYGEEFVAQCLGLNSEPDTDALDDAYAMMLPCIEALAVYPDATTLRELVTTIRLDDPLLVSATNVALEHLAERFFNDPDHEAITAGSVVLREDGREHVRVLDVVGGRAYFRNGADILPMPLVMLYYEAFTSDMTVKQDGPPKLSARDAAQIGIIAANPQQYMDALTARNFKRFEALASVVLCDAPVVVP